MENFKLGNWLVNPTNSTIKNGHTVKLDQKVMQLLCFLVEHQQTPVSREQIMDAIWGEQVVADDVLNVAMSNLRKHLKDDPKKPTFIKTLPRKGYQIIAPMELCVEPRTPLNISTWILASVVVVAITAWYLLLYSNHKPEQKFTQKPVKIAVLPFDFFAEEQSQLFIADGLTEAITNRLVQEKNFLVTSRTSVMDFRKNKQPIKQIAEMLDVDWILEGSVQIQNSKIQVTAQLIEVETDKHLWSETYRHNLNDLFAIQTDISSQIARKFRTSNYQITTATLTVPPIAYNHYLRARYYHNRGDFDKAEQIYQQALSNFTEYAEAYAGIAQLYYLRAFSGAEKTAQYIKQARNFSQKAYALSPSNAYSLLNMALDSFYGQRDYAAAGNFFEKAFNANNQDIMIQEWYISYLLVTRQQQKAVDLIAHMRKVSPLVYNKTSMYLTLYYAHDYDAALEEIEAISPYMNNQFFASAASSWIYMAQGDADKLHRSADKLLERMQLSEEVKKQFQSLLVSDGVSTAINFILPYLPKTYDLFNKAELLAWSNQKTQAIEILKKLESYNDLNIYKIHIEPAFLNLRGEQEFELLLQKLKLTQFINN